MADNDLSVSSISAQKLDSVGQEFGVAVLKKAIDQQGEVSSQLIAGATGKPLPEGVGNLVNVTA